jgi:hypothetical protein
MENQPKSGASGDRISVELAELVLSLNPKCLQIGAGMMAQLRELATRVVEQTPPSKQPSMSETFEQNTSHYGGI